MPIPLIVWGIGLGVSGLWGGINIARAKARIKSAKEKYTRRRRIYEEAIREYQKKHEYASDQFKSHGKTRLQAFIVLGNAVTFLAKAKLKERELFERFKITPEKMLEWETASIHAVEILGGLGTSALSGVSTSAAVYGLVGTLATASTGTAISVLSGAAATNATLAWIGEGTIAAGGGGVVAGTMVFGGLVTGPALLVFSFVANSKAGDVENQVEEQISKIDTDEAQKRKLIGALEGILQRAHELRDSTIRMQEELKNLLEKSDPQNEKDAYLVAKTAKALGELLDIAILNKNGKLV